MSKKEKEFNGKDFQKFVQMAQSRNKLISQIKEEDRVLWLRDPKKTQRVLKLCNRYNIASMIIDGVDNLQEAYELHQTGNELNIVSNHQTDVDHTFRRIICQSVGLSDWPDRFVFAAGLKMIERPWVNFFMPGENALVLATPFDFQDIDRAMKWAQDQKVPQEKQELIEQYQKKCNSLNYSAVKKMRQKTREGYIFYYYPEATRSRDGLLGRAQKDTCAYLKPEKKSEKYILPMVVDGLNQVFTAKKIPLMWRRAHTKVIIGRPYPVEELHSIDLTNIYHPDGTPATLADVGMARMAILDPLLIRNQEVKFYEQLFGDYNPRISGVYPNSRKPGHSIEIL